MVQRIVVGFLRFFTKRPVDLLLHFLVQKSVNLRISQNMGIGFHIVHVAYQIQELEHVHVLRFDTVAIVGSTLAALDDAANGAVQAGAARPMPH